MAFVVNHPDEVIDNVINQNKEQIASVTNPAQGTIYDGIYAWLRQKFPLDNDYNYYRRILDAALSGERSGNESLNRVMDALKNEYLMTLINSDNALDISKEISNNSAYSVSPEQQQTINNFISENMANTANTRQIEARDSSLLSTAQQLQQLGLNMGSVASLGGASAGVAGAMAQADKSNNAQQMRVAKFNEKAQMTRTLIGLLGGMASAGIYGGAVSAAKKAASQLANEASHYATDTKFAMFDNYERVSYKTKDGGYLAYNHYKW